MKFCDKFGGAAGGGADVPVAPMGGRGTAEAAAGVAEGGGGTAEGGCGAGGTAAVGATGGCGNAREVA